MTTRSRDALDDAIADDVRAERLDSLHAPDSADGRALGRALGENVARFRGDRGLSVAEVARRSGIEEALLEELERGEAVPSLRAIWHLATALEVPFGLLLESGEGERESDFRVQRQDAGRVIESATGEFRSRVLFREGDPRTPEVYELTLAPGCVEDALAHAKDTFEHITVVAGTLKVRAGDSETRLGPGDALFFRADVPHRYENAGTSPVQALLVMQFGARR